ncbi:hypothetical protein [Paenibacillus puerhi]|uniref:hypothetical protein n=1 Tax=Paenibacillus puerhi TaxID=2692622 RepID=UPI00135AEE7E|nr:hypothetical protein [Paenibacillus puerhi]
MSNKNIKLRIAWIIPTVFMYLAFLGSGVFLIWNISEMDNGMLGRWVTIVLGLFLISVLGTLRIMGWIKNNKI